MNGSVNYRAVFVSGGHVFQPVSIMKMVVTGREKSPHPSPDANQGVQVNNHIKQTNKSKREVTT